MKKIFLIGTLIFIVFAGLDAQTPDDITTDITADSDSDPFVVPENLKDNVAFWKKIYTEVALSEGLLHDSDYPMVIYKKITIGNLRGRARRGAISKHTSHIRLMLDHLSRSPSSRWSEEEKKLYALFKTYGAENEIKTARSRIRFQQGQRDRFKEGLERSGAYLGYIRRVFKQYGIPQRIAYLPHVESSFNINAYSKVGAAGMWQFMRRTGQLYMTVNYKVDERRDPYISTVAAAKLLVHNYRTVKAWPLAITAYNHGLVSIQRAVNQLKTRDIGVIVQKYRNRRFRFASKNFYSCFLAASEIGANPRQYFPDFNYHLPEKYNELVLQSYISPSVLSEYLGVSQKELIRLNPSLRTTVFQRRLSIPSGFRLRIPAALSTGDAEAKIAAIPGSKKAASSPDNHYYSVRRGDTLYRISRRFKVSTESILASNDIRRGNRLYVGQVLQIPGEGRPVTPKKTVQPLEVEPAPPAPRVKEQVTAPVTEAVTGTTIPPRSTGPLKSPRIELQTAETTPDPGTFDATLYDLDVSFFPGKGTARIQVAVDETLGHYADWLGVSTYRIRSLNRMGRRSLKLHQRILVPMSEDALERFNARRLEYHMALEEDFYNEYEVVEVKTRKVKYGETLWSICNTNNNGNGEIPFWLFKKYNRDLDMEHIKRNAEVNLPVIKGKVGGKTE